MARKSRRNKIAFIIISILLLAISGIGIYTYFYFDKKIEEKNNKNKEIIAAIKEKQEILDTNREEIVSMQGELDKYNDLDKKLEDLKNEYYASIKELEDQIISGK